MKSFKQFINEQLNLDDLDDLDDFGDDFGDDLNLFPDSLSNLKKLSEKDVRFYKNLIASDLEYDNGLAEAGLNNEGIAVEDFIEFGFYDEIKAYNFIVNLEEWDVYSEELKYRARNAYFKSYITMYNNINNIALLSLSYNRRKLTKIIPEIFKVFTDLIILELTNNQLTELPPEIGNLTKLKYLDLYNNNLKELPKEIGELKNLENLSLKENYFFKKLPIEIGQLENLKKLDISWTILEKLPEIGNLKNLEELQINANIDKLPSIKNLKNLTFLKIARHDQILPEDLKVLQNMPNLLIRKF
jgi:hypothetical protein